MNRDLLYEDITDIAGLKKYMNNYLKEYNNSPGVVPMDLVLFRDAMEHGQPQGWPPPGGRFFLNSAFSPLSGISGLPVRSHMSMVLSCSSA